MEGQGPEHSSCRIERFLQAMDDAEDKVPDFAEERRRQIQTANMQVLNVTTPAQLFHALRRQMHRGFRKPLVIASPKSLLRAPLSTLDDLSGTSAFQRLIPDTAKQLAPAAKVDKLLLVSGKLYYELEKHRADKGLWNVAIARVEQIAPFPFDLVAHEVQRFPNATVAWVQEEPRNMGAWTYVAPRIRTATHVLLNKEVQPFYEGRVAAASPAAGSANLHKEEQARVVQDAFTPRP